MPRYKVKTPKGAFVINAPEGATPLSIFGFAQNLEKKYQNLVDDAWKQNPSNTVRFAGDAKLDPPPELAKAIAASNASLPAFQVLPEGPAPRFIDKKLNAGGYTISEGPLKQQVIVANPQNTPRENILAHEAFHSRKGDTPAPKSYKDRFYDPRDVLARTMKAEQPFADVGGPYWGLFPNSSAEEQIASLQGYEGGLPKGTSIVDTDMGKRLLPDQITRDYYFTQSSVPYGGIWEGQVKDEWWKDKVKPKLDEFTLFLLDKLRKAEQLTIRNKGIF